jgi:2-polyprenyl-3-methyl-5-hydroxy-6-metoxy-1,4-benzoquinol methylase
VSADRDVSWRTSYARHCRDHSPNALVVEAVSTLERSVGGRALDIGAGSLSSSRHLLSAGFTVDAVDNDPHVAELAAALDNARLLMHCVDIRDVELPERTYNFIVAMHILHLIPRSDLRTLMPKIAGWLTDDGVFCATFLGTRDSWAPTPWRATVLRPDEVVELTSDLEVIRLDELEYDGTNVLGQPKHWHTLRGLFRKTARSSANANLSRATRRGRGSVRDSAQASDG